MRREFTLEYWLDDGWYVGRLRETSGVFSQGRTLEELEENIRDAFELTRTDELESRPRDVRTRPIELDV